MFDPLSCPQNPGENIASRVRYRWLNLETKTACNIMDDRFDWQVVIALGSRLILRVGRVLLQDELLDQGIGNSAAGVDESTG